MTLSPPIYVPDPNAPVTMSNAATSSDALSHMAGVGSLQNTRHFLYLSLRR